MSVFNAIVATICVVFIETGDAECFVRAAWSSTPKYTHQECGYMMELWLEDNRRMVEQANKYDPSRRMHVVGEDSFCE